MHGYFEPVAPERFIAWLGTDADKWTSVQGSLLTHAHFGDGLLAGVGKPGPTLEQFTITIEFSSGLKRFPISVLGRFFVSVRLKRDHEDLWREFHAWIELQRSIQERLEAERVRLEAERVRRESQRFQDERRAEEERLHRAEERRRRAEEERRREVERIRAEELQEQLAAEERLRYRHEWEENTGESWSLHASRFRNLARQYNVPGKTFDPDDPLYSILEELDAGHPLPASDLRYLAYRGAPALAETVELIQVKEVEYRETNKPEILAAISSLWRKLNQPERAQEATSRVLGLNYLPLVSMPPHVEAMLLTTCGGSLRDQERLNDARICANRAIGLRPHHGHAYCLLGAIEAQSRDYESSEMNFARCKELNPAFDIDNLRRDVIWHTKHPSEYAAYLFHRDPEKFSWAGAYLREQSYLREDYSDF